MFTLYQIIALVSAISLRGTCNIIPYNSVHLCSSAYFFNNYIKTVIGYIFSFKNSNYHC